MSRTTELCNEIDAFCGKRDIEGALQTVEKLAEMRVKSKTVGFEVDRQEEIIQDCVVAAWQSKFEGRNDSKFSTWVMSIIQNQIHSAFKVVKQERESTLYLNDEVGNDKDGDKLTLEEVIGSESSVFEEYRQVKSQPFPSEEAFEVFDLQEQGLSLKEIAQRKGTTYGALRQRVSRWTREMKPVAE
jgi:RNA polymerase sigma factor (sigma-70 family)